MYSEYGRSMLATMTGSMNLRYCCCALPFSPPLARGYPSSREMNSI